MLLVRISSKTRVTILSISTPNLSIDPRVKAIVTTVALNTNPRSVLPIVKCEMHVIRKATLSHCVILDNIARVKVVEDGGLTPTIKDNPDVISMKLQAVIKVMTQTGSSLKMTLYRFCLVKDLVETLKPTYSLIRLMVRVFRRVLPDLTLVKANRPKSSCLTNNGMLRSTNISSKLTVV